jgi:NTP pyrophosphatase (non-canonical NTP hydrolase)
MYDFKVIKEIVTKSEIRELLNFLASENGKRYNLRKCAEELNELAAVCLKMSNKKGEFLPDRQEIIDEAGDVLMRVKMVLKSESINPAEIRERIRHKANKYLKLLQDGTYSKI